MKKLFSRTLSSIFVLSLCVPAVAAPTFQERVTYLPSVTSAERTTIHAHVDALSGVYVSVNLAITDESYQGVGTVVADSKTDLYSVNPNYLASNPNPVPERGAKEQRGFFLFGDGSKNAEFTSPEAIYVSLPAMVQEC